MPERLVSVVVLTSAFGPLTRVGRGLLPLPGGIAQAPNGDIYVSINSAKRISAQLVGAKG